MASSEKAYRGFSSGIMQSVNTFASVMKVALKSGRPPRMPVASGETCIVLGNGPSLKQSLANYPNHFIGTSLMCVNTFSLAPEFITLKPTYYVMLDPGLWNADNELVRETMLAIANKTNWKLHLFIPREARNSSRLDPLHKNRNIEIRYINYVVFKGTDKAAFYFFRKNLAMPQSQNVLVASLFTAINLGYKRIELFGADHSWHEQLFVDDNNVVCLRQVHFYENESEVKHVPFYKAMHIHETFRMDEAFGAWAKVFAGYIRIRKYADSLGCKIYNASERSFVDAFERIRIGK